MFKASCLESPVLVGTHAPLHKLWLNGLVSACTSANALATDLRDSGQDALPSYEYQPNTLSNLRSGVSILLATTICNWKRKLEAYATCSANPKIWHWQSDRVKGKGDKNDF